MRNSPWLIFRDPKSGSHITLFPPVFAVFNFYLKLETRHNTKNRIWNLYFRTKSIISKRRHTSLFLRYFQKIRVCVRKHIIKKVIAFYFAHFSLRNTKSLSFRSVSCGVAFYFPLDFLYFKTYILTLILSLSLDRALVSFFFLSRDRIFITYICTHIIKYGYKQLTPCTSGRTVIYIYIYISIFRTQHIFSFPHPIYLYKCKYQGAGRRKNVRARRHTGIRILIFITRAYGPGWAIRTTGAEWLDESNDAAGGTARSRCPPGVLRRSAYAWNGANTFSKFPSLFRVLWCAHIRHGWVLHMRLLVRRIRRSVW